MTIIEAITMNESLKPGAYSHEEKTAWLSRLDMRVHKEIMQRHEGGIGDFQGYKGDTPPDTPLLVPEPYDEMYLRWLEAQADYANGEIDRYNNSISLFNSIYSDYERFYRRGHRPLGARLKLK